jgi:hypothetical protein
MHIIDKMNSVFKNPIFSYLSLVVLIFGLEVFGIGGL